MELTDIELKYCFDLYDSMEVGDYVIVRKVAPNKPERFIEASKRYHDIYKNIQIKSDYSEIRKVLTFKQQIERFI